MNVSFALHSMTADGSGIAESGEFLALPFSRSTNVQIAECVISLRNAGNSSYIYKK